MQIEALYNMGKSFDDVRTIMTDEEVAALEALPIGPNLV